MKMEAPFYKEVESRGWLKKEHEDGRVGRDRRERVKEPPRNQSEGDRNVAEN